MFELLDALLGIIAAGQFLKVITDKLIEALAEGIGLLSSSCYKLLINGQRHVHEHSICAHVSCVNWRTMAEVSSYRFAEYVTLWQTQNQRRMEVALGVIHIRPLSRAHGP